MKIPQKRIVRKLLSDKFLQAFRAYRNLREVTEKNEKNYVRTLIDRTFEILESIKIKRSHKQLALYFMLMRYLQENTPDIFAINYRKAFNSQRSVFTSEWWHRSYKEEFDKVSIDFYHMEGTEATQYVNDVFLHVADNIYHLEGATEEDRRYELTEIVKRWTDDISHGRILLYD